MGGVANSAVKQPQGRARATSFHYFFTQLRVVCCYLNALDVGRSSFDKTPGDSIQFILYSPISQITNSPQRALRSVHVDVPDL